MLENIMICVFIFLVNFKRLCSLYLSRRWHRATIVLIWNRKLQHILWPGNIVFRQQISYRFAMCCVWLWMAKIEWVKRNICRIMVERIKPWTFECFQNCFINSSDFKLNYKPEMQHRIVSNWKYVQKKTNKTKDWSFKINANPINICLTFD